MNILWRNENVVNTTFCLYFPFTAQITQWDLIFYGTNEPPQANDPPRYPSKTKNMNDVGSEMEHNSLDGESNAAAGQWRDLQQVSISLFLPFLQLT